MLQVFHVSSCSLLKCSHDRQSIIEAYRYAIAALYAIELLPIVTV